MSQTPDNKENSGQLECTDDQTNSIMESLQSLAQRAFAIAQAAETLSKLTRGAEIYCVEHMQDFTATNVSDIITGAEGQAAMLEVILARLRLHFDRVHLREHPCTCAILGDVDAGTTICDCHGRSPRRRSRSPSPIYSEPGTQPNPLMVREGASVYPRGDYETVDDDAEDVFTGINADEYNDRLNQRMMRDLNLNNATVWNAAAAEFHDRVLREGGRVRTFAEWEECLVRANRNAMGVRSEVDVELDYYASM